MADERGLQDLDPYALLDREATRLSTWFGSLDRAAFGVASRCEGWSRRDVLAHLCASEEYHRACLDGQVGELLKRYVDQGGSGLDDFNAMGVAAADGLSDDELLARWRTASAATRQGFRTADGTTIDSSVGAYPARCQAFHVAFELAVHADDVGAPVTPDEQGARLEWMAAVARFALTEVKPDVAVDVERDGTHSVVGADRRVSVSASDFVAGVSGRGDDRLDDQKADLLSLGY